MTVVDTSVLGRPIWYELMTTDVGSAEAFYRAVVGWTSAPFTGSPQPYINFRREGGVGVAGLLARPDDMPAPPFWSMYVAVPSLDDAVASIEGLGGRSVSPIIDVPTVGRVRMMSDPQGALFYIHEPVSLTMPPEGEPALGEVSWRELMTTDAEAAMRFYQAVFGWQPSEAMDMGPAGKYQMFDRPHGMIGGMMNTPPEMGAVPPAWQIYFTVPEITAAAARVTEHGGRVINGPMQVPGGSWVLNATDREGAVFGLHARA